MPALAFDHDRILRVAIAKLKEQIHFQPIGFELLPDVFTMSQLQALYEAILEETGDRPKDAARTVPVHYRFNLDKYKEMKSKGFRLEF